VTHSSCFVLIATQYEIQLTLRSGEAEVMNKSYSQTVDCSPENGRKDRLFCESAWKLGRNVIARSTKFRVPFSASYVDILENYIIILSVSV